jgi:phosphohistidine phosphatase
MMRDLILLRHAKSSWDDPKLNDHARPLNARGQQNATALGHALRDQFLPPQLVLVSSARRTLQTMQAIGPFPTDTRISPLDTLYLANNLQLLEALTTIDDAIERVLVIGHNPGLHQLALRLAGAHAMSDAPPDIGRLAEGFPTCALAAFTVAGPWWSLPEGGTRIVRFVVPRDFSELAI